MPGGYRLLGVAEGRRGAGRGQGGGRRGEQPLRKVFSKEQRAFYAEHAPEGLGLDDLPTLGPIFVLKLKTTPAGLRRRLVTELWLYPDGSRVLELSTRCARNEAFQVAAEGQGVPRQPRRRPRRASR